MNAPATLENRTIVEPPLVVDLDGTLIKTDSLFEGVARLLVRNPLFALMLPLWLMRGKAGLKREIADRVELDVKFLPYDTELLAHLKEQRVSRRIVLCTATDHRFANAVAAHLGIFDEVLATSTDVNLSAGNKANALVQRFGDTGFDYAGNAADDMHVFSKARRSIIVDPTFSLRRRQGAVTNVDRVFRRTEGLSIWSYFRAMRLHQWVKNLLVFLPIVATLESSNLLVVVPAILAFVSFGLVASSVYLLNDLLDLGADRRHPRKRERPFAAGAIPLSHGLAMIPLLLAAGMALGARISLLFLFVLVVYYACTMLYTFWLKRVVLLDTLVLAGLYTLRILAGAAAISVVPSFWLLAFSMFFFLSVALAKRHAELVELQGAHPSGSIPGREYRADDINTLVAQGSASGYAAVMVLALYINSDTVRAQYHNPEIIWLICPLLLYWINKLWLNAQRRQIHDDPLVWAMSNRVSRGIAALSAVLLLLARWLPKLGW